MTNISTERDVVTLINVFTVKPEDQQRVVDVLTEAAEEASTATSRPTSTRAWTAPRSPTTCSGRA